MHLWNSSSEKDSDTYWNRLTVLENVSTLSSKAPYKLKLLWLLPQPKNTWRTSYQLKNGFEQKNIFANAPYARKCLRHWSLFIHFTELHHSRDLTEGKKEFSNLGRPSSFSFLKGSSWRARTSAQYICLLSITHCRNKKWCIFSHLAALVIHKLTWM